MQAVHDLHLASQDMSNKTIVAFWECHNVEIEQIKTGNFHLRNVIDQLDKVEAKISALRKVLAKDADGDSNA